MRKRRRIMDKKGLSISMIFKAQSLNYGEGIGNISELKKLTRGDGSVYTFASRQALRYDIVRLGERLYDWKLDVVDKAKGTIQFKEEYTIADSQEMDLFGYMKTKKKSGKEEEEGGSDVRSAAVRLSNAIALEEYKSDMDFLNNKGMADRIHEFPNLANIEQHLSFYTYTITIDLEKVGIDGNLVLPQEERAKRIKELLEIIKVLNREIRGREENLSPLFMIGGMYRLNSPFFLGRIQLNGKNGEFSINETILKETMDLKIGDEKIGDSTKLGMVKGVFKNEDELCKQFDGKVLSVQEFFEALEKEVEEYYQS